MRRDGTADDDVAPTTADAAAVPRRLLGSSGVSGGSGGGVRGAAGGSITNGIITLTFDGPTGFLTGYSRVGMAESVPLTLSVGWYNSSKGGPRTPDDGWHGESSGRGRRWW